MSLYQSFEQAQRTQSPAGGTNRLFFVFKANLLHSQQPDTYTVMEMEMPLNVLILQGSDTD